MAEDGALEALEFWARAKARFFRAAGAGREARLFSAIAGELRALRIKNGGETDGGDGEEGPGLQGRGLCG